MSTGRRLAKEIYVGFLLLLLTFLYLSHLNRREAVLSERSRPVPQLAWSEVQHG